MRSSPNRGGLKSLSLFKNFFARFFYIIFVFGKRQKRKKGKIRKDLVIVESGKEWKVRTRLFSSLESVRKEVVSSRFSFPPRKERKAICSFPLPSPPPPPRSRPGKEERNR
jgi:hypothetical protein